MKTYWVHQVARTRGGYRPFLDREWAVRFWKKLQQGFPERVLAACLMPNHLHVIWATGAPARFRHRLAAVCRGFTREFFPGKRLWEPLPAFDIIGDLLKLETTLRYVHLNPCRARLTSDPWNWEFSTLQEHTFPVFQPWVDREALKTALESQLWTERLNSWPHRHAEWVLQDAWVDPGVRERLWEMPDLKALSWDDCVRLLERALVLPRGQFQRQGKHRNVAVKLLRLREPEVPIFRLAERLGMARCHVGALLKQPPLSRLEEEALRHLARCLPSPNRRVPNAVESEGKIVHERVFSARFGRMNGAKPAF